MRVHEGEIQNVCPLYGTDGCIGSADAADVRALCSAETIAKVRGWFGPILGPV